MGKVAIHARSLGVNFPAGLPAGIVVWSPYARSVSCEIQGKNQVVLRPQAGGYWEAACPFLLPGDRYMIRINDQHSYPDPASLAQPDGVHGPSAAVDLNAIRQLRCRDWNGVDLRDLVIYELHTGTFTADGTFAGVSGKLTYLKELGIRAIELMPVASFPGERNWGYDGVFPFSVQHSYGGAREFAGLVKKCHEQGIAVILDVVYNHFGPAGNCLDAFGPYVTGKHSTPWGKAVNFDDAGNEGVRRFVIENALMWLRDYHVDGLRLDALHAIRDSSAKHIVCELSELIAKLNAQTGARHFLIGETGGGDARYTLPLRENGFGLDLQWCDGWHHALHSCLTGEKHGYYRKYGQLRHLCNAYNHVFASAAGKQDAGENGSGASATQGMGNKCVTFLQNHDQVGNRALGERLGMLTDFESSKLAAAALLFSPFVPMLFMGEEHGAPSPFLYFIDHGDPVLAEKVRKGRMREFRHFYSPHPDVSDPSDPETFRRSIIPWDVTGNNKGRHLLMFYKECIRLRKHLQMLGLANSNSFRAREDAEGNTLVLTGRGKKKAMVMVLAMTDTHVQTDTPELIDNNAELLLYSAHKKWGGVVRDHATPLLATGQRASFAAEPRSAAIFLV